MSDQVVHAIAGAGGGMISMSLTYPLITIATRLQVQQKNKGEQVYRNTFDAFTRILKEEGVSGLYSGWSSGLFGIAVTNGVYYYWYETVRTYFEKPGKSLSTMETLLSGALAGAATSIITNPIWVVNTRMTANKKSIDDDISKGKPLTFIETSLEMFKEDGLKSFFQGIVPALILVINPTMQYFVFEKLKENMQKNKRQLGNLDFFLLGAISKLVATFITYPYIVVKSRMQLKQSNDSSKRYAGILDAFTKIISEEGILGLYKGLKSKITQSVLTAAILFLAKENLFIYTLRLLVLLKLR